MEMNSNIAELREIENEVHTDLIPGTEVMTDVGRHHFVKGARQHVLVPQPSADPHDPLNWSPMWKGFAFAAVSTVSFTQGLGPLALAPMFPYYIQDFHSNLPDVVKFTGVAILVLGFSNFIWVPLSTSFGRRPVLIFSQLVCLASSIWRAEAMSYGSFMGACVLNGIGAGPGETIQPAVIADIFFLHDRGKWLTAYWVIYMGCLMMGPIFSGSISFHVGWRNFWCFNTAIIAASLLMVIFMFPETKWHRVHPDELSSRSTPAREESPGMEKSESARVVTEIPLSAAEACLGKGRPSRAQWGIYTPNPHSLKAVIMDVWTPWKLFAFPIVEFAAFVVSWSCSCFLALNLTQSLNFAGPPYNFDPQTIGFLNFAILIGALIGLATAGPFSDWVSDRATKRNGGIREPEMRLPAMIPYVLIMILGSLVVAYGYEYKFSWPTIVVVGYVCIGIQVAALPAMASTYAVDSYKPVAGSLMVAVTVNKNVYGYGFSEYIIPWCEQAGFVTPIATNMALATLWCLFGVLFYFYGKTFRRWSAKSSVHQM